MFNRLKRRIKDRVKSRLGITSLERAYTTLEAENARLRKLVADKFEVHADVRIKGNSRLILIAPVRTGIVYTVDFDVSKRGFEEVRDILRSIFGREWPEMGIIDAPTFIQREFRGQVRNYK